MKDKIEVTHNTTIKIEKRKEQKDEEEVKHDD